MYSRHVYILKNQLSSLVNTNSLLCFLDIVTAINPSRPCGCLETPVTLSDRTDQILEQLQKPHQQYTLCSYYSTIVASTTNSIPCSGSSNAKCPFGTHTFVPCNCNFFFSSVCLQTVDLAQAVSLVQLFWKVYLQLYLSQLLLSVYIVGSGAVQL